MLDRTPDYVLLSKPRLLAELRIARTETKELVSKHRPVRPIESEPHKELRLGSADGMLRRQEVVPYLRHVDHSAIEPWDLHADAGFRALAKRRGLAGRGSFEAASAAARSARMRASSASAGSSF